MNVLVTGATGYVGRHLAWRLLSEGHHVTVWVRDPKRLDPDLASRVGVMTCDLLTLDVMRLAPKHFDTAYYLVHSMGSGRGFERRETLCAQRFVAAMNRLEVNQVIYLGGIINDQRPSRHIRSRQAVEEILFGSRTHVTSLRAGIIVGSGSASFEIIRDLVEKLPVMVTPKWIHNRCQPVALEDVLFCLLACLGRREAYGQIMDIGGSDTISFKQMMDGYARIRGLRRLMCTVPVLTPRISSYWLYAVTNTSFSTARHLVEGLSSEYLCDPRRGFERVVPHRFKTYRASLKDAMADPAPWDLAQRGWNRPISAPRYGVVEYVERRSVAQPGHTRRLIASIGGKRGWYVWNWAWRLRGVIDRMLGGPGMDRGRRDPHKLHPGDALDCWRVVVSMPNQLLLKAEMKIPGEAWLEFRLSNVARSWTLQQRATFRPKGLLGRAYWYTLWPIHRLIFSGLADFLADPQRALPTRSKKVVL